jgi:hypothetical protein
MARPRAETPKNAQVNVRLTDEQSEVLAAIAFVEDVGVPEFVRALVDREIAARSNDPLVEDALRIRQASKARAQGTLTTLPRGNAAS